MERGSENRDSDCRERSTETESKCEKGDEKQTKEVEKYVMLSLGRTCPVVPWPSVWQAYDEKIIKLHWHFMHNQTSRLLYGYMVFSL